MTPTGHKARGLFSASTLGNEATPATKTGASALIFRPMGSRYFSAFSFILTSMLFSPSSLLIM